MSQLRVHYSSKGSYLCRVVLPKPSVVPPMSAHALTGDINNTEASHFMLHGVVLGQSA